MQSTTQNLGHKLSSSAEENRALLSTLAQTDYALASWKQNRDYINDLKTRLAQNEKEIKRLHLITEDERKDHVKYRDSNVKRFVYKLGGNKGETKFSQKAEKEEREFLEAWQKEREAQNVRDELTSALKYAEDDRVKLETDKARNENAQADLDALYRSIFDGPTPELPSEDQAEEGVKQANESFQQRQHQLGVEKQALKALKQAQKYLNHANSHLDEARSYSRVDLMGGGMFADMAERSALSDAELALNQVQRYMHEAQAAQPAIGGIGTVNIDGGHILSDVVFDSIWTDLAQHDRIKASTGQVYEALRAMLGQVDAQKARLRTAQAEASQSAEALNAARRFLQDARAAAFETYASNGFRAPPAYH